MNKTKTTNYTLDDLRRDLDLEIRDTEANRELASKVPDIKALFGDGWKTAIQTQIEVGLTKDEKARISLLNKENSDLQASINTAQETIKKLRADIQKAKDSIAANTTEIADISANAGVQSFAKRTRSANGQAKPRKKYSDLTPEEKEEYKAKRKQYAENKKAREAAAEAVA